MTPEDRIAHCVHHGYSFDYLDYWQHHPSCEICGQESQPPHHCRTRGSGGPDEAWNLLALCVQHHRMAHNIGDLQIGRMVGGELQAKIMAAKKHPLTA